MATIPQCKTDGCERPSAEAGYLNGKLRYRTKCKKCRNDADRAARRDAAMRRSTAQDVEQSKSSPTVLEMTPETVPRDKDGLPEVSDAEIHRLVRLLASGHASERQYEIYNAVVQSSKLLNIDLFTKRRHFGT